MARRERQHQTTGDAILSRGIIAILLVILAVIIGLSFFEKSGTIGIILNEYVLAFLFGKIRYVTPGVLAMFAWFLIQDRKYNYRSTHSLGATLFFLALSSIMHIGFDTSAMWAESLEGNGGGVFGMLAWPLKTYLGSIASIVLLIGLTLISLILMFNTAITHIVMVNQGMLRALGWAGRTVVATFKTVFVKSDSKISMTDEEEDIEEERDLTPRKSLFTKKAVSRGNDEEDEADDEEETEDDEEEEKPMPVRHDAPRAPVAATQKQDENGIPAWQQNVIIRDLPPIGILSGKKSKPMSGDIETNKKIIDDTFREFGIDVEMEDVCVGPTVTQYTLKPNKGVKLSRITGLSNDLAMALAAHPIRIEAPIPGKALVGIEVPNQKTAMVTFRELLESKEFQERQHNMMVALGRDVGGKVWFADLPRMPHLLIAGATGSGKTVCMNTIIMSLLYQNTAETLRMIMVDPKRVELTNYNGIPHLLTPVITNTSKTVNALKWMISEMERRFEVLSKVGSRDIASYNKKKPHDKLPYIVFIIDELADLMATAANDVEAGIIRIAQMARAVGIHLIVATQRPSVDVITGLMKANIPGRIAFSVASVVDSRTILDAPGADKLLGRGDMLLSTAELSKPVRIQGAYISEEEMARVVEHLRGDEEPTYDESIVEKAGQQSMFGGPDDDQDPLFSEAKEAIMESGKASASYLQRRLRVGYARAARLLDELEQAGIIGPGDGAKPRDILMTKDEAYATMNAGQNLNVYKDSIPVPSIKKVQENWPHIDHDGETDTAPIHKEKIVHNPIWDSLPEPEEDALEDTEEEEDEENIEEEPVELATEYRDIDENALHTEAQTNDDEATDEATEEDETTDTEETDEDERSDKPAPKTTFYY